MPPFSNTLKSVHKWNIHLCMPRDCTVHHLAYAGAKKEIMQDHAKNKEIQM